MMRLTVCLLLFQVTSSFGNKGQGGPAPQDSLTVTNDIHGKRSSEVNSKVTVNVVDIRGNIVTQKMFQIGRYAQLRTESSGEGGEVGIKITDCDAVGTTTNIRYPLIRGGCGDGHVFPKDRGFTTVGLVSMSPYFSTFRMKGESSIRFECNANLCSTPCDGNSCTN